MPLIEVKNLTFKYKNAIQPIINKLSLSIGPGEFVSIQGPSGSGKSTLLYLLAGFLHPNSGEVKFADLNLAKINDLKTAALRNEKMGFIFQHFHLLPRKSVLENILLPTNYPVETEQGSDSRDRAIELCEKLGLSDKIHDSPNKLSGGQQQRVAIARALLKKPRVLFADEPTGNLDSKTGQEIFKILEELTGEGISVVIITHDQALAARTKRRIQMRDGEIVSDDGQKKDTSVTAESQKSPRQVDFFLQLSRVLKVSWGELQRNRSRSFLTLLGIMFGVAAVSSMVTLGDYTKKNILKSYQDMGVNTFGLNGYPNYIVSASGKNSVFTGFQPTTDMKTTLKVFPQIAKWTPLLGGIPVMPIFGGKYLESAPAWGVNENALPIMQKELALGRNFHPLQIEQNRAVCIIGSDIKRQLFRHMSPINEWLLVRNNDRSYSCQIIGVLKPLQSSGGNEMENKSIYIPYGFYGIQASYWWEMELHQLLFEARPGTNIEKLSRAVANFFRMKYGETGEFYESTNAVMLSQMRKFLTLFTILLLFVSGLSLIVGCIGVSNMMTVSVSDRVSELGLRKAVGATNQSLRLQILCESSILCFVAGVIGILVGFVFQQTAIYGACKLFPKLPYTWEFNGVAALLAVGATFLSGYISGIGAAKKVEQLSVAEVLRSE